MPPLYGLLTRNWAELGFTRKNLLRALLVGVVVGVVIGAARYGLVRLSPELWVGESYDAQEAHEYYDMIFGSGYYLAPLLILLFIPITTFQEIFYRGYLQVQFANRLKPWIKSETARMGLSIGLSSLLYALWLTPDAAIAVEFIVVIYFTVSTGLV